MQPTRHNFKIAISIPLVILLLAWLSIQLIALLSYGIVTKGESEKYIGEANFFWQHHYFSQPKYLFYSVYVFIQLFFIKTGMGSTGVYIFQLVLNLASLYYFYKMARYLFDRDDMAWLATLTLIFCFPWQLWTTHLYTESVFISLVLIFSYYLFKPRRTRSDMLLTCVFFLLLLFCRPTGILFLPALLCWFVFRSILNRKWLVASLAAIFSIAAFVITLNYAMKGEGEFDFLKPFTEEHIICGVPGQGSKSLKLPDDGNSVQGLLYYMVHNPGHFCMLAAKKLFAFFGFTRTWYSSWHNAYLMLFFYPLYLFAIAGIRKMARYNREALIFMSSSIVVFAISITFTCDDWLNRFIMPIIPFLVLTATPAMMQFKNWLLQVVRRQI